MDKQTVGGYQARAKAIKALAHPSRLFIVEQISKGERCVCDLRDMSDGDLSTVSRHLRVLKDAGVVADERRGFLGYYMFRIPFVLNLFGCIEGVLRSNADVQLAALKQVHFELPGSY